MSGMPGWAFGLGALLKGPEYISSGFDLYKNIRDDQAARANDAAARDSVDNLAWAAQEPDPAVRLENFREVSRDLSTKPLTADTALKLQTEVDRQAKGTMADVKTQDAQNQLAAFQKEAAANGMDLVTYGTQHPDRVPLMALQGAHNALQVFATGAEKEIERRNKEAKEQEKQGNIAAFQSAIAGLTGQSTSPNDLARFAKTGGYAPFPQVESDIRQAAADYNVGDSDEINKAITGAREEYKNTFLPPQTVQVGRTTATGQTNLLGDFRKDVTSTAPVVKVSVNQPAPDAISRDAQAVMSGQLAPKALSKRNGYDAKVRAEVLKQNPSFDFVKADANATYAGAPGNLQSRALIQGVEPLYDRLLEAGKALGNSSIPGVNKVKNWVKEATGQPEIVAFNNLRDDVIAESERILMGSGVLSDSKYLRAVKNVSSAASVPQLNAAIRNLRLTVKSRLEALDKQPFPGTASQPAKSGPPANLQAAAAAELARRRGGR